MNSIEDRESQAELQRRFATHETSVEVAGDLVAGFEEIASALGPIIGSRGVAALISRSVHLAGLRHPWLNAGSKPSLQPGDYVALTQAIVQREVQDAALGGSDLLHTFRTLLSTLIGRSLTENLLRPAWKRFSHDIAVKKASP